MKKGELTKQKIIEASASIFNQKGYAATSIDDIINATGLKQGGIYRHFSSKEDIAKACFQYSSGVISNQLMDATTGAKSAKEELFRLLDEFVSMAKNPPITGGCPILNTSIDCDDTNEDIRELVQNAVNNWKLIISSILSKGITQGEFKQDTDVDEFVTIFISAIEGSIFLAKLYDDASYIIKVANYIKTICEKQTPSGTNYLNNGGNYDKK